MTSKGYEGIGGLGWLAFNTARKPFDDARVRQAIATPSTRTSSPRR